MSRWAPYAVLLVLVLECLLTLEKAIDFEVYYRGAHDLVTGVSPYRPVQALPFTYPPFAALVIAPFTALDVWPAHVLFQWLSMGCLLGAVWLVSRRLGLTSGRAAWGAAVALLLEPVTRTFGLGQINLYLMMMVVLDLLLVPRRFRGILIGLAAGIKLVPATFAVIFLFRREWSSALRAIAAGVATIAIMLVIDSAATIDYWTHLIVDPTRVGALDYPDNSSLVGVLARLIHANPSTVASAPVQLLGLGAGCAVAWLFVRRSAEHDDVAAMLAVAAGGLLGSPVSWSHHYVWAVPLCLYLWRRGHWSLLAFWLMLLVSADAWLPEGPFATNALAQWQPALLPLFALATLGLAAVDLRADPVSSDRERDQHAAESSRRAGSRDGAALSAPGGATNAPHATRPNE